MASRGGARWQRGYPSGAGCTVKHVETEGASCPSGAAGWCWWEGWGRCGERRWGGAAKIGEAFMLHR